MRLRARSLKAANTSEAAPRRSDTSSDQGPLGPSFANWSVPVASTASQFSKPPSSGFAVVCAWNGAICAS
eukprot:8631713-Lingulodinium_polyedra.AAC.1